MDDLEADPSSRQRQTRLAEDLSAKNAAADAELIALAQRLIDAIRETEAGRKSLGKYNIEALGAQVGVIGDGTRIEGGIHFHNYGGSGGGAARSNSSANGTDARQPDEPCSVRMNILHLSDLHFGTTEDAHRWHGQLADDLKQELHCDKLDAMIITGDVAIFAVKEEYNAARIFIERVCAEFKIPSASLAIVPGNHDLNWKLSKKGYILMDKEDMEASVGEGDYIPESESIIRLKDDEAYQKRFSPFSQFYL